MKFLFAKKTKICKHCITSIERGELYILNSHRNKTTGRYFSFPYHYECYIDYFTERIRRDALYYMKQLEPPKKLGRPRKYSSPIIADRLGALIRYHRKAGNELRVSRLTTALKGLELDNNRTGGV